MPTGDAAGEARRWLRRWLTSDADAILANIDTLGRAAIVAAADASGRLERSASASCSAQRVLADLHALAATVIAPPARRRPNVPAPGADAGEGAALSALIEGLDRERDAVARTLITFAGDRSRLQAADDSLEEVAGLIRAATALVEAAAREIAVERPDRAALFRDKVAPRLIAREQDILTQLAVTRQGLLALGLLTDTQQAVAQAIDRARETSLAALRTAIVARRAVADSQAVAQQADALARSVDAAQTGSATPETVRRTLDDAMAQVRRAIDAARTSSSEPPSAL